MMDLVKKPYERIKLVEINPHLTCFLCKGYYIDATTISECLHSFCRSCIIKFLHEHSYCPICEVIINKAKPNLKLDKTLQDIVYKLVPELFLNEMKRRQRFYQNHPDLATKVTPEERGEDTERTIFNPRDTISLSIEYISDDSTPGAILIPQLIGNGADINNRNKADKEENSAIKRFLQCPGMCRVEVLKKFIRNKYNVDTNQYYIDILYKRVPLPDHYTLIDIAYIYSWKRNEPLKFFFKITDINLVTDSFDYLICPQVINKEIPLKTVEKKSSKNSTKTETNHEIKNRKNSKETRKDKESEKNKKIVNEEKPVEGVTKNVKNKEYTNITLDRRNNVEIITKIQKVSNKDGLQIGIKVTKQTVTKSASPNTVQEETVIPLEPIKSTPPPSPNPISEIDPEKSNFLKSIELTAKNVIQALSPQNLDLPKTKPNKGTKRKNTSPIKTVKPAKTAKKYINIQPKSVQNPTVWQMMSNVNQNVSNLSKIVDQNNSSDLQALLFDSYKINIPASLSVTVKNEKDGPTSSPFQKPVQNYIEILKIPDRPDAKLSDSKEREKLLDRLNSSVEVSKIEVKVEEPTKIELETNKGLDVGNIKQEPNENKSEKSSKSLKNVPQSKTTPAYLPCKVTNMPSRDNFVKLNPRTPQTFQKMFEEAIKKPEFSSKFQTVPISKNETPPSKPTQKNALNLATNETPNTGKRNILEIASKLYKKTKMEQEKTQDDKTEPILENHKPRQQRKPKFLAKGNPPLKDFNSYISSKPPQTVTSLHSPTLGLNYTVSVTQANLNSTPNQTKQNLEGSSPKLEFLPKHEPLNIPRKYSTSPKLNLLPPVSPKLNSLSPISPKLNSLMCPVSPKLTSLCPVSPKLNSLSPVAKATPPKLNPLSPVTKATSPKLNPLSPVMKATSPKLSLLSPVSKATASPKLELAADASKNGEASPGGASKALNVVTSSQGEGNQPLSPNQILEKYNIQNLAQMTANFNFPPNLCMSPAANQLAAIHQAMIYRHFEMHNHQNWLNMNSGPLMQYEKYLQSLSKS